MNIGPLCIFGEMAFSQFFIGLFDFLLFGCRVFDIFWIKTLIRYKICIYFYPFCGLYFHSLHNVHGCTKFLILMKSNLPIFFLYCFSVEVISKKL